MQEIQESIGGECAIYRKGLEKEHEKRIRQMKLIDKIYIEAKRGKRKELEPEEVCTKIVQIIEKEGDDSEETERNKIIMEQKKMELEKREREKAEEYDKERIKKIQEATQVEEEVARDYLEEAEYDTSKAIKEIISDKKKEEQLKYNDSKALSKEKLKTGKPEEKKEESTKKGRKLHQKPDGYYTGRRECSKIILG